MEHLRGDEFLFINQDVTLHLDIPEPVDVLYHLAALASPIDYLRMPLHSLKVGSYGTHNALGLAKFKRARFLLASTSEVSATAGASPAGDLLGERQPDRPSWRLRRGEAVLGGDGDGVPLPAGRGHVDSQDLQHLWAPHAPQRRACGSDVCQTGSRGQASTVFGDGTQTRSFCYVDDLIRGLVALAESGEHLPVNLGNPAEFTLNELAEVVLRITGSKSELVYEALPVDDPQVRQPDITRARQLLGWEPKIQLEEGLRRMLPTFGREPVVA